MEKLYNYIDSYLTYLLLLNKDVNTEISNIDRLLVNLNSGKDLLGLGEKKLFSLIDYLVLPDSENIKNRIHYNWYDDGNLTEIYLNNLVLEIKSYLLYLKDNLNNKIYNNNKLIDRCYNIYNAFDNGKLVNEIVDFNIVYNALRDMNVSEEYKTYVINTITETNLEILKKREIVAMKYYLTVEEYDIFNQYNNLIDKKRSILKKYLSKGNNDINYYNLNNKCFLKLDEIARVLNDIQASIDLFFDTNDPIERQLMLKDKDSYFKLLRILLNNYYELEDELLDTFINEDEDFIEANDNADKVNLIYLTKGHNGDGKVLFLDTIKNIPFEYYEKLYNMITSMENKSQYDNLSNNKVLTANLRGLWERKAFKLRIYYKKLSNNCVLILFCDIKKSNETLGEDRYVEMLDNWADEINNIEKVISNNDEETIDLISVNKDIHKEVKECLSHKGRKL